VVDDLHHLAGIDAGQVGQDLEAEIYGVVQGAQHVRHVARRDADLGLVVALADRDRSCAPGAPRGGA
jgi:hypothetical protein